MRYKIAALGVAVALVGCMGPMNDMLDNDFATVTPQAAPAGLVGTWTGSSGPWLMTMVIQSDGSGATCQAWGERQSSGRLKYDGYQIRFQDGGRLQVESVTDASMQAKAPYRGSKVISFVSDPEFSEAAPYCTQELKKPD